MTKDNTKLPWSAEDPTSGSLPLVSVVISNYNYGSFLSEAIRSIFDQSYRNIECIVVDDCSTDDSEEIIAALNAEFRDLICIKNERNCGQSASCYHGFTRSSGAFIIFLDADDYLFSTCIEIHVRTHLSLRLPVGLTSVDMVQIVGGKVTTTTSQGFSEFVRSREGVVNDLYRPYCIDEVEDLRAGAFSKKLHYVHPSCSKLWPWSPTSGNCFRRDALDLIMYNDKLSSLRSCTDIYLLRGVAALTGSVLIDQPLAGYRVHGANTFIKTATVNQIRVFDPHYLKKRSDVAMSLIIDHLVDNAVSLTAKLESPSYYKTALNALDEAWPPIVDHPRYFTYLTSKLIFSKHILVQALGQTEYNAWLIQKIMQRSADRRRPRWSRVLVGHLATLFIVPFVYLLAGHSPRLRKNDGQLESEED